MSAVRGGVAVMPATITGLVLAEGLTRMAAVLSDTQALTQTAPRSTASAAELRFCSTRYQLEVCLNFSHTHNAYELSARTTSRTIFGVECVWYRTHSAANLNGSRIDSSCTLDSEYYKIRALECSSCS